MKRSLTITAALEDYLEAIFNLSRRNKSARSRDIAESLGVHKSTVTAALKSLGGMNLINYAPYEAVTLTREGERLAKDVVKRHDALKGFFTDVLMVDEELAEKAACGMEHAMPKEIVERLAEFAHVIRACPRGRHGEGETDSGSSCLDECVRDHMANLGKKGSSMAEATITLDGVKPGNRAEVVSLSGDGAVKRRMAEMGVMPGSIIEVERVAPLGDPLDVKVKGYRLSLRKEEAAKVHVKQK